MRDVLLLFGMQGSGKGTQAERVKENFGYTDISIGKLLRDKAKEDPSISEFQKSGELVPDEIVEKLVEEKIESLADGEKILFDGFPRLKTQLDMYKRLAEKYGFNTLAILIDIPEEEAVKRIGTRYTCSQCEKIGFKPGKCEKCGSEMVRREDDTEGAVRERIGIFKRDTAPLTEYFKEKGELAIVDGVGSFDEVTERIFKAIDKHYQK
ncbi:adenylate kinase [candidate division WS5 bacterium]|uniref:Adenylate kinase n=1 Tax=candidate division WS5 bacterium TaxID=2093353 RepID=A0A419DE54_9BACT|nr:MAG: adenylate kinase [candidate division WS5 bacterium]